jgi:hypothetical protein
MNFSHLILGAALAMTTISSCGGAIAKGPPMPVAPTTTWRELTTTRFDLLTNLDEGDARHALQQLTQTYDLVRDIMFPDAAEAPRPLMVVIFRSETEYRGFAPRGADAFVQRQLAFDPDPTPIFVFSGELDAPKRTLVAHEISHVLTHLRYRSVPVWINEGLAEYVSTIEAIGESAYLGRTPPNMQAWTNRVFPTFEQLRALTTSEFYAKVNGGELSRGEGETLSSHYVAAWCGVHMLMNGSPELRKRFDSYLQHVATGDGEHAWQLAFSDVPTATLQSEFESHLARQFGFVWRTSYEPKKTEIVATTHILSPADVLLLEGRLLSYGKKRAPGFFEEAARLAPMSASPHVALALSASTPEEKLRELELAHTIEPTNAAATILLAEHLATVRRAAASGVATEPRERELWDAAVREAKRPWELNVVAWQKINDRSIAAAFVLAKKAVVADPLCFECWDTLAVVYAEKSQFTLAYDAEMRAIQVLPEGVKANVLEERLRKFDEKRKNASSVTHE